MAQTDREALGALYNATGGPNWKRNENWNTYADLSKWHGIGTNDQGRVVGLSLHSNNLRGSIPKELGALSNLWRLDLYSNQLTGPIPPELGNLRELTVLWLRNNQLTGPIPPELGKLAALKTLWLQQNELTGSIPPELGNLAALKNLILGSNMLSWTIPKELGKLIALDSLYLDGNKFSGTIPEALGKLTALQELHLDGNRLTGHIPSELGALSELRVLRLNINKLTGHIPQQLGNLSALESLDLSCNRLDGPIPKELGTLSKLKRLWLANNHLTALWDHTQDVRFVGHGKGTNRLSGGPLPPQLRQLLNVFDSCPRVSRSLGLWGNPWVEPPEAIVSEGVESIRGYFEDLYAEPYTTQRKSVKIILVGQECAGKTSLRQSMKVNKAAPTGEWKEESTVFADVEPMELEGASVRVYDCAGQVSYTGLLQMFLTPRSVCVLVCNAEAFENRGEDTSDQTENDCGKLEELRVCDWLRSISRRIPNNAVILVATKCDLIGGNPGEIGRRMEEACRTWLESWVSDGMQPVRVEPGVCLTSCCAPGVDGQGGGIGGNDASKGGWACDWRHNMTDDPPPSLLYRLVNRPDGGGLRGAQMVLPRSWDIALTVLEALECGRDPVEMTVRKLADPDRAGGEKTAEPKGGVYGGITMKELSAKWQKTVLELERRNITVANAENALEGALSIREFDGSLIRHEMFVFLDVVWLARILKPLLNHKDEECFNGRVKLGDTGDTRITLRDPEDIASWDRLKNEGILEPRLARAMWPAGLSKHVLPTLVSLGMTFPLENDPAGGLVVLLRLKPDLPAHIGEVMRAFCSKNTPALSASWKIFLGVPAGAVEKVLTRCCSIGDVRTFWRFGVLVHGDYGDGGDGIGEFAVVLEYSSTQNELTAQVFGDKSSPAPWAALSYVISAVRLMLLEFPGLNSKGRLECPQHGYEMHLDTEAARTGEQLVLKRARCPKCLNRGQGAAAFELLRMVDIRLDRDVIFGEVKARFVEGKYSFPLRTTSSEGKEELIRKIDERFDDLTTTVKVGFDEVNRRLDRVTESLQESLGRLKNLQAPNYPYPHLVVVKEVETQGKRSLLGKLRGKVKKDMTLHFLCSCDMSKVPCGVGGEGYRFRETRDWVKKLSPVVQVAVVTAKVALKAVVGLEVDVSDFLQAIKNGLGEELVDRTLDEDALLRVVSGTHDAGADMQRETKASYEAVKKFMEKEEANRNKNFKGSDGFKDFKEKMQREIDGEGGMVWVRNENVQKWRDSLSAAAPLR